MTHFPDRPGRRVILVTGATGYIGGRLVPELLDAGWTVRCLARTPAKLEAATWRDRVEVVEGDVLRPETLAAAMAGCEAVYDLVHAIGGRGDWAARDARAAANVRDAAAAAGLGQIVYLGGMGDDRDAALSPHLASRQEVGRVLAAGPVPVSELRAAVIIGSGSASFIVPGLMIPYREAVRRAPAKVGGLDVGPRWADATGDTGPADAAPTDPDWAGGSLLGDDRVVACTAPAPVLFRVVSGVGGERGWYVADWLWGIRGLLDAFAGGVGRRRGRRHPDDLRVGDTLDFWRVEAIVPDRMLRLRAEMRLPGHAWLEWEIHPDGDGSRLEQRACFAPRGLLGRVYWYGLLPVHALLFPRLAPAGRHRRPRRRSGAPLVCSVKSRTHASVAKPGRRAGFRSRGTPCWGVSLRPARYR